MNESESGEPFSLNTKGCRHGTYKICKGDRVAQMVFAKVESCVVAEVASVADIGEDRGGGFGSTGV